MGQEDTSPIEEQQQEQQQEPPKQTGTIDSAASALAGLLTEEGNLPDPEGQTEEPEAKQPEVKAPEQKPEAPKATIAVKIGDKDYSIPVPDDLPDEVKSLVKDGLLMRADYSRKTMETAEERKALNAERQQVRSAYQATTQMADQIAALKSVETQLQQLQQLDWKRLESEDMLGHIRAVQAFQGLQQQRGQIIQALDQGQQALAAMEARQLAENVRAALPLVKKAIPDFSEAKVQEIRQGAIKHYGEYGVTDALLNQVSNAFELAILHDALQFRALQGQQQQVQAKVEKLPPKVTKPGVAQTPGTGPALNQAAMGRLQRSGKVDDAAAAIKSLLG